MEDPATTNECWPIKVIYQEQLTSQQMLIEERIGLQPLQDVTMEDK